MRRYDLTYRLIPSLISNFNNGKIRQVKQLEESFFKEILELEENEFNIDDLIIKHKILSKTKSVGVYIFPEPQKVPEALFGLLFFDFKTKTTNIIHLKNHTMLIMGWKHL